MLTLRYVTDADALAIYRWRRDSEAVRYSEHPPPATFEEHLAWFATAIQNPYWWIGEDLGAWPRTVGVLRLDRISGETWVSITVDPLCRRRGYGVALLAKTVDGFSLTTTSFSKILWPVPTLLARISRWNLPSIRLFEKAGYILQDHQDHDWSVYRKAHD